MDIPKSSRASRADWRKARAQAIEQLIHEFAPCDNEDLLDQMVVTICRLAADNADRGDLKILNTALKELRYAFKVFRPYTDIPKVSMFGSARTPEDHPQYAEAKKFAELIQRHGWMVITGAGDGIMRAGHHGATQEASFGVAISLPFEQRANTYIEKDPKLVNFKYFFTRKLVFVKEARAIALFPGGFGTQDEGFEALTLVQTLKTVPTPIVMCDEPGGTYWRHWLEYVERELLGHKMIDPTDLKLFHISERAEDAVEEILRFYRRYHSSRYVGDALMIRMNEPVSQPVLEEINDEFSDIVVEGRITQSPGPLSGEGDAYPDKTRLTFVFNRRSASRLRMLIDKLNHAESEPRT
jgi:uncharacterized protein (TIGR00730 family)